MLKEPDNILSDLLIDSLRYNKIWIEIKGNSMAPLLKEDCCALVSRASSLRFADVLVFRNNHQIIAHRLIRRLKDLKGDICYQTKADNGYVLDEPIRHKDILGKIIAIKRKDRIIRLDTFLARIKAMSLWCISILRLIIHKYVRIQV